MKESATCSFCKRTEEAVERLISGPNVYICDRCIRICTEIIDKKTPSNYEFKVRKPKEIKEELDNYIIGQEDAMKALSVAVYNHYNRINSKNQDSGVEFSKSNVLLLGPTGSGKTLVAKTLASIIDVPFTIADATTLTEAGYVGEDVENIILRLLAAADYDVAKAEKGIIYIDEIDKLYCTKGNVSITRDVSGEGVQQALLKIVEGTIAHVPPKGGRKHPNQAYINVNTENILFIVGGAFVNLDKIIAKRLGKSTIGFGSNKDNIASYQKNELLAQVEPEDFIQFGMIPEFVGRFSTIVNFNELTLKHLTDILVKPKNALIKQFKAQFSLEGVNIEFAEDALEAIANLAIIKKTGARALRFILENLLRELMYEVPSDETITDIYIDKDVVNGLKEPLIKRSDKKIA